MRFLLVGSILFVLTPAACGGIADIGGSPPGGARDGAPDGVVAVSSSTAVTLRAVWAGSSSDAWAVGDQGAAVHWDGAKWTTIASGVGGTLNGVWGNDTHDVYMAGILNPGNIPNGVIAHWNGSDMRFDVSWLIPMTFVGISGNFAISNSPSVTGRGAVSAIIEHDLTKKEWLTDPICKNDDPLLGIWTTSEYAGVRTVGASGQVYWGPSLVKPDDCSKAFVQDGSPRPVDAHFTGPIWASPNTDSIWVVGQGGTVFRWLKASPSWLPIATGTTHELHGVWGSGDDVYAVGDAGTILHFRGGVLLRSVQVGPQNLYAVGGTSASDAWAAGEAGVMFHLVDTP